MKTSMYDLIIDRSKLPDGVRKYTIKKVVYVANRSSVTVYNVPLEWKHVIVLYFDDKIVIEPIDKYR